MLMYKLMCVVMLVHAPRLCWAWGRNGSDRPRFEYPLLYRDHVFTELSEKGRELFYAIKIHPSCLEKKGVCIQRGKCIENRMIYISRVCYHRDLVCCFDDTLHFPEIEHRTKSHATTATTPTTETPQGA